MFRKPLFPTLVLCFFVARAFSSPVNHNENKVSAPKEITASVNANSQMALVEFVAPSSNESTVTNYVVTANPGGFTGKGITSPVTVAGLSYGVTYTFTVTATNNSGGEAKSGASNPVTPYTVPGPPITQTASVSPNSQSAEITWVPAPSNGSAITGYIIKSNPGGFTVTAEPNATSGAISGLTYGVAYTFTVTAANAAGTGASSTASNAVTPYSVPGAPTTLIASINASSQTAKITWAAPPSNGAPITEYKITSNPKGLSGIAGPGATSGTISGLAYGESYTFTVAATNAAGAGATSTASAAITPYSVPGAATEVSAAINANNQSATVKWSAPSSNGSPIKGYTITSLPGGLTGTAGPDATSATVSGLTNGIPYTFTVTANNEVGTGAPSNASNSIMPYTVPGAPINVTESVSANSQSASIGFTAPPSNGSTITKYKVTASPGGMTATGTSSPITVSGLTYGTAYTFTVEAINGAGTGAASAASDKIIPYTVPSASTAPSASIDANSQTAFVDFTAPPSNGSTITSYTVTANPGGFTGTASTSPVSVTGLSYGTPYTFTVTAANAAGSGLPSLPSKAITPYSVPGAATAITASVIPNNQSATIRWSEPYSNGAAITGYTITSSPGALTAMAKAGETSATVSGLNYGTPYTFTVTATNAAGTGFASASSAAITPYAVPDAPTGINESISANNQSASVGFTAPSSNGSTITNYTVTASPGGFSASGSTSPITVAGLEYGTAYTFSVSATNAAGTGKTGNSSSPVIPYTVPDAPINVMESVSANSQTASVGFTAPPSNGSAITSYTITASPGGFTGTGPNSPITVTGLSYGTPYTFTVTATNAAGTGVPSKISNPIIPFTMPGAAANVTASVNSNAQTATVSWSVPPSNGSDITGYTITSSPGGLTGIATAGAVSGTVSGLTFGTPYTFTVTANNAAGSGAPSGASNSVTPFTLPNAPSAVTASVNANDQMATISWSAPPASGSAITGYKITSSPEGWSGTAGPDATSATVSGLAYGTSYTFTVTASNAAGAGISSTVSNTVIPFTLPGSPASVTANITANSQSATINWTEPSSNGSQIKGYTITSNPGGLTSTAEPGSTSGTISGLTYGIPYTFTVAAINAAGTGTAGKVSNIIIPYSAPAAPAYVKASILSGSQTAILSWTAPSPNGKPIAGYTITSTPGGWSGTAGADATSGTVTGLSFGTSYTFTLVAMNEAGTGAQSIASNAITPVSAPSDVNYLSPAIYTVGTPIIPLSPTVKANGSPITGYTIRPALPAGLSMDPNSGVISGTPAKAVPSPTKYTISAANSAGTTPFDLTMTVNPGNSVIAVTGVTNYVYNGSKQGPSTYTESGSTEPVTINYTGVSGTTYGPSTTPPSNAGSYTATAVTKTDDSYKEASSSAFGFTISPAASSITVTGAANYTYNGLPQGPSKSTVSGSAAAISYSYSGTGATTYGPSFVPPANAGTYSVIATVAADANNSTAISSAYPFSISTASSSISVKGTPAYTANGSPQGPAMSIIVGSTGIITYSYAGTGSTVYGPSAKAPTNAGTYNVTSSVAADANYNAATSSPYDFKIN
jgi:hypothetical protein